MGSVVNSVVKPQLIQFIHDLSDTLKECGQTDLIVMDFSKAFDKVDHQWLLPKLHRIGIISSVVKWISAFLYTGPCL